MMSFIWKITVFTLTTNNWITFAFILDHISSRCRCHCIHLSLWIYSHFHYFHFHFNDTECAYSYCMASRSFLPFFPSRHFYPPLHCLENSIFMSYTNSNSHIASMHQMLFVSNTNLFALFALWAEPLSINFTVFRCAIFIYNCQRRQINTFACPAYISMKWKSNREKICDNSISIYDFWTKKIQP